MTGNAGLAPLCPVPWSEQNDRAKAKPARAARPHARIRIKHTPASAYRTSIGQPSSPVESAKIRHAHLSFLRANCRFQPWQRIPAKVTYNFAEYIPNKLRLI